MVNLNVRQELLQASRALNGPNNLSMRTSANQVESNRALFLREKNIFASSIDAPGHSGNDNITATQWQLIML